MAVRFEQHIVIIGNGIAGITAAQTIRKLSNYKVTVISGENPYFYARTALMYLYLGLLKYENIKPYEDWYWSENKIELVHAWVTAIDFAAKSIALKNGQNLSYDKLLLATGSKTAFHNWPGQHLTGVHGFYDLNDLALIEKTTQTGGPAIIVGGGLIGVELAEMLHSRGIDTSILVRGDRYWGKNLPLQEAEMIRKRLLKKGIKIHLNATLQSIEGNAENSVCSVTTNHNEVLLCKFIGIATGVTPNIDLVKNSILFTAKGIKVNKFLETNQPDIYAAGDCAELTFAGNQVEQLWYTGRMQGETVAYTICGQPIPYKRGIPFNSAKFFDLEFQSYGTVNPELSENESSIFWKNASGTQSIRLNYLNVPENTISGFVLLNVRYRQEICEKWILEKRPLEYVVMNLRKANFDPEFHRHNEKGILQAYNSLFPEIEIKPRRLFSRLFR
jgi:NADPH-dependent 2,4-dienoyl-CoA reductase/sulfur reductase-like enzyme